MFYPMKCHLARGSLGIPGVVLQGLGQMLGANRLAVGQIGDRARQLEDAMVGSGCRWRAASTRA